MAFGTEPMLLVVPVPPAPLSLPSSLLHRKVSRETFQLSNLHDTTQVDSHCFKETGIFLDLDLSDSPNIFECHFPCKVFCFAGPLLWLRTSPFLPRIMAEIMSPLPPPPTSVMAESMSPLPHPASFPHSLFHRRHLGPTGVERFW